jgi:hypothetical protein
VVVAVLIHELLEFGAGSHFSCDHVYIVGAGGGQLKRRLREPFQPQAARRSQ